MERIVDNKKFAEINKPLRDLRRNKKNLVVNVCTVGRHRSVANSELQVETIRQNLYNNQDSVGTIDLQSDTHWKNLCAKGCPSCDPRSEKHVGALDKAGDILESIVPVNRTPSQSTPVTNTLPGYVTSTNEVREVDSPETAELKHSLGVEKGKVKEAESPETTVMRTAAKDVLESRNIIGVQKGEKRKADRRSERDQEAEADSILQILKDACSQHSEATQVDILSKLLHVFRPKQSVLALYDEYDGSAGILEMIMTDHSVSMQVILAMFEEKEVQKGVINLFGPPLAATAKSKSKAGRPWVEREPNERGEYDSVDSPTIEEGPESEDASNEPCRLGNKHPPTPQPGMPEKCDWGGPKRGGDGDGIYMREERTGGARYSRSSSLDPEKRLERQRKKAADDKIRWQAERVEDEERLRAQQRRGRASSSHLQERSRSRDVSRSREVSQRRSQNSRHRSERTPSGERERGRSRGRSRSNHGRTRVTYPVILRPKGKGKGKDKDREPTGKARQGKGR